MKPKGNLIILLAGFMMLLAGCGDSDEVTPWPSHKAKAEIYFRHRFDTLPLIPDSLMFTTQAGTRLKITDLQYFISKMTFHMRGGGSYTIESNRGIHYTDLKLPETLQWFPADIIPEGTYDSIRFIFGLNEIDNVSNRFPDPPERDMFWPEILGGGYHYMKMNTVWEDLSANEMKPFMMHLGIGQLYSTPEPNVDSITGFVQNYFTVSMPADFTVTDKVVIINLVMQADKWFNGPPNTINPALMPPGIMQDENAMRAICQNGRNAFRCTVR